MFDFLSITQHVNYRQLLAPQGENHSYQQYDHLKHTNYLKKHMPLLFQVRQTPHVISYSCSSSSLCFIPNLSSMHSAPIHLIRLSHLFISCTIHLDHPAHCCHYSHWLATPIPNPKHLPLYQCILLFLKHPKDTKLFLNAYTYKVPNKSSQTSTAIA